MTNEKLLDLLREARRFFCLIDKDGLTEKGQARIDALYDNVDAALAERQDSATGVVESESDGDMALAWQHSWMQEREASKAKDRLLYEARTALARAENDLRRTLSEVGPVVALLTAALAVTVDAEVTMEVVAAPVKAADP
jgi:hypothetical protein